MRPVGFLFHTRFEQGFTFSRRWEIPCLVARHESLQTAERENSFISNNLMHFKAPASTARASFSSVLLEPINYYRPLNPKNGVLTRMLPCAYPRPLKLCGDIVVYRLLVAPPTDMVSNSSSSSPSLPTDTQDLPDEERPLLSKADSRPWRTPLDWPQIYLVLLMQLCEPLASQSIYPYINQLVSELDITGGDERKVGYYAGLIESLFFFTQALTVLSWSRVSDHVGRKPVLLVGLIGLSISMFCFGLSRIFWALVISRCICGMLNGNIGVMKSVMGELTDSSNRAEGFSLMPVVWSAGASIGPLIGGGLSRPHDRFPTVFSSPFWEQYPYFLPCAVVAALTALSAGVTALAFKETLHARRSGTCDADDRTHEAPVPLRALLVPRVLVSVFNYVTLAFLDIGLNALQPLFFAMPVAIGGLGLDPPQIGYILGAFGALNGAIQAVFFARIINRWNPKRVFKAGIAAFIPIFTLFPLMNVAARAGAPQGVIWVLICLQLAFMVVMDLAYGCIFMFVTSAAPNKRSLGSTNGLAQTSVSFARAIGPALTASMFSFSVQYNILGGKAVYVILVVLAASAQALAARLPENGWKDRSEVD